MARTPASIGRVFASLPSNARRLNAGHRVLTDRQRNGGAEDVAGIVMPLGFDQPLGVATIAFRRAVRIAAS